MRTYTQARKPATLLRRVTLSPRSRTGDLATPAKVRQILQRPRLQPKLTVGPPDDAYEREADRVAEAVMRMPEPGGRVQRRCSECEEEMQLKPQRASSIGDRIQRVCPECEEAMRRRPTEEPEEEKEEGKALRAQATPGQIPEVTPELESRIAALNGSGQPLPSSELAFFEPRFGRDFGAVRLHTGSEATEVARRVAARAFTLGRSVVFAQGEYRPGTTAGRRLLAHELTHVVQQDKGAIREKNDERSRRTADWRSTVGEVVWMPKPDKAIRGSSASALRRAASPRMIRRQEPVTTIAVGAVVAKCIIGAITGALFDAAIQAALYSIREGTWRFWRATLDYCSIILSAIIGCIAAPIAAFALDGWVTAQLGPRLGGVVGTLIGKILLFIAQKLAIAIPKSVVKTLAKLGCISPEQASELGVQPGE